MGGMGGWPLVLRGRDSLYGSHFVAGKGSGGKG